MMHTLPPESREDSDFKLFRELTLGAFSINICTKEIIALRLIYADDSIFEPLGIAFGMTSENLMSSQPPASA